MIPARREALAHWSLVAALCGAGLAVSTAAIAAIGSWWCLGIAAFFLMVFVQLWRIAARPIPPFPPRDGDSR